MSDEFWGERPPGPVVPSENIRYRGRPARVGVEDEGGEVWAGPVRFVGTVAEPDVDETTAAVAATIEFLRQLCASFEREALRLRRELKYANKAIVAVIVGLYNKGLRAPAKLSVPDPATSATIRRPGTRA